MKIKIIIAAAIIIGSSLFSSLFPTIAFAKTNVDLSTVNTTVSAGDKFTVVVSISPTDETAFTSKVSLSYSIDTLDASSFTFAPTWLSLSQTGFDLMDTATGKIIKTAGFPNGIVSGSNKKFGTITFTAKSEGVAKISVSGDTQIYGNSNNNIFSGEESVLNITVVKPTPSVSTSDETTNTEVASSTFGTTTISSILGASAVVANVFTSSKSLLIILVILILGAIGFGFYRKESNN